VKSLSPLFLKRAVYIYLQNSKDVLFTFVSQHAIRFQLCDFFFYCFSIALMLFCGLSHKNAFLP